MNKSTSWFNVTSLVVGFAFLYVPILILVAYSFNASKLVTVWGGFSTRWYVELLHDQAIIDAAWVTIRVGILSASFATVLGTMAALVLDSYRAELQRLVEMQEAAEAARPPEKEDAEDGTVQSK